MNLVFLGALRRGNKPPVIRGEEDERSKNKTRELKASAEIEKEKISEYNEFRFGDHKIQNTRRFFNMNIKTSNEIKSTAHSKYRCQYHIVLAPKYRRKEI